LRTGLTQRDSKNRVEDAEAKGCDRQPRQIKTKAYLRRRARRGKSPQLVQIQLLELLLEYLTGLEFNYGSLRNYYFRFGLVRIAANPLFPYLDFQHTKVSELNVPAIRKSLLDNIQRLLDSVDNLLLRETGFAIDLQNDFAFG
jgi:hypothetical protein